ncbi:hypothetical protein [Candidatus Pelagibacter sp. Uisw_127]|uniref:hypothetical protein n=1 Tax=Candidatus Pelagibacter sp. Uisw_127 TaxID=3230988 RepID=UPI0039E748D2
MKRLLLILILTFTFQSLTKADDIRDFEIEGMSIGDSLLDFASISKIENNKANYFINKKYTLVTFNNISKTFENIDAAFLTSDKNYIIKGISGTNSYKFNFKDCIKDKDNFMNDINNLFKKEIENNLVDKFEGKKKHTAYPMGNSFAYYYAIKFKKTDNFIAISCLNFSKKDTKTMVDHLRADIYTNEYDNFLVNEAYK